MLDAERLDERKQAHRAVRVDDYQILGCSTFVFTCRKRYQRSKGPND